MHVEETTFGGDVGRRDGAKISVEIYGVRFENMR